MRGAEAFAANVDEREMAIVCRTCRKRLDVQRAGEWVPTFPDRDVRGYALPKLIVPGVRIDQLVANSRKTRPDQRQAFHNRDLGEPYAPAEHRLSLEQVRACVREDLRLLPSLQSDRLVVLGCDVASVRALNVVIEEVLDRDLGRRVFVGEIEDGPDGTAFEQLCALMHRYNVTIAGIDRAPERRFSSAFANTFPGRVVMVGYFTPAVGSRGESHVSYFDEDERILTVWRTVAIDAALERSAPAPCSYRPCTRCRPTTPRTSVPPSARTSSSPAVRSAPNTGASGPTTTCTPRPTSSPHAS
jgi:hypothetical protein